MDHPALILQNIIEKVGCNGVRNFGDLGNMRQETIERRLKSPSLQDCLTSRNIMSIYCVWLVDQIRRVGNEGSGGTTAVQGFCSFLKARGCRSGDVMRCWDACARSVLSETTDSHASKRLDSLFRQLDKTAAVIESTLYRFDGEVSPWSLRDNQPLMRDSSPPVSTKKMEDTSRILPGKSLDI